MHAMLSLLPNKLLFLLLLPFLVAGCAAGREELPSPNGASATMIMCHAAYRSSTTEPIEEEAEIVLDVDNQEERLTFDQLALQAVYVTGERAPGERSVRLAIMEPASDEPFVAHLYQLPRDSFPLNQFEGGHGFTGLSYVYHPESGAELQYWCFSQ